LTEISLTTSRGPRRAPWRERWARLENQRRGQAYQVALAAWQRRDAEYRHQIEIATATRPSGEPERHAWLRPEPGETVHWAVGGVGLVETRRAPSLRLPDHRELFHETAVTAGPPIDTGHAAVTSRRVIFLGQERREWTYVAMTGLAHAPGGLTVIRAGNRKRVSGVAPPPGAVADFRANLAVAMADAVGEREALVAELEERADRHRQARPPVPGQVTVDEAPMSARLGRRGVIAVVSSALVSSVLAIGTALAANDPGAGPPPSPTSPAQAVTRQGDSSMPAAPLAGLGAPSPTGSPSADPDRRSAPGPGPGAGDCAAYVDSGGWCTGGVGDYDCEGGDGPNYAPRNVRLVEPGVDPFGLDPDGDGVGCGATSDPPAPDPPGNRRDPRFDTCQEAVAAGYGPYRRGEDPEYKWYPDPDDDGVVCD
jgi:hypothetical protein